LTINAASRVYARSSGVAVGAVLSALLPCVAQAERIENEVAVFAALDKVTARISKLEVPLGQTVDFGSLKVTPRSCYSRPATEQPKTTSFVEVDEKELEGNQKRIFTGWMFAESPGLHAVEHPVFDIWLTGCDKPRGSAQAATAAPAEGGNGAAPAEPTEPTITRRRLRR
jgi:hypothetical protein